MDEKREVVGVIVARFQVDELHEGHRYLIDYVRQRHETVLIVLGTTRGVPTAKNPLTYEVRKAMVQAAYPMVSVMEILDHPLSSNVWSEELDALIENRFPGWPAALYGGRDSFREVYNGKIETRAVPPFTSVSGTDIRNGLILPNTREARAAMIYAANHRYPIIYPTVDAYIVDPKSNWVLLIGKDVHQGLLSFPGGFNDRKGESDEDAVKREVSEEVPGIITREPVYIGSKGVDDPRYRGTPDGITTRFFKMEYLSGQPEAGDDANRVEWVPAEEVIHRLVPWHVPLAQMLLER